MGLFTGASVIPEDCIITNREKLAVPLQTRARVGSRMRTLCSGVYVEGHVIKVNRFCKIHL